MSRFALYRGPHGRAAAVRIGTLWPEGRRLGAAGVVVVLDGPRSYGWVEKDGAAGRADTDAAAGRADTDAAAGRADVDASAGFAVVGLGLRPAPTGYTPLDEAAWSRFLQEPSEDLTNLAGHFVAARWQASRLTVTTDRLGIRCAYAVPWLDGLLVTTDLVAAARLAGLNRIDKVAFGSHWLLQNQIGDAALLAGVDRLVGGTWSFGPDGRRDRRDHAPVAQAVPVGLAENGAPERVREALRPTLLGSRTLGLSGGLDSRTLLAAGADIAQLSLHSFGPSSRGDVRVAEDVARRAGRSLRRLDTVLPSPDELARRVHDLAAAANAVSAASSVLDLYHYAVLHAAGLAVVDGGFGEVGRRVFLGRLLRMTRRRPGRNGPEGLFKGLRFHRPAFLSREFEQDLHRGALDACRSAVPVETGDEAERWADHFGLRHRLPNFFGYEQARLDAMVDAFMPFAQPAVVEALLAVPLAQRRNGHVFKALIRQYLPEAARLPLVKGGGTVPFGLPPVPAMLWLRLRHKREAAPRTAFLRQMAGFIADRAHEADVAACGWYDVPALRRAASQSDAGSALALDGWLVLDAWRRAVGG